jgi:pimeloyl-ACP methyl ester carboxylesterase
LPELHPAQTVREGRVDYRTLSLAGEGRTLHVAMAGEGRSIVLIHGALATHSDWMGPLVDGFAQRGRVFVVDRPGHGDSQRPRYQASPRQQADQIREGLQKLGLQRPLLIGHSFGAIVASAWAAAYPDEIAGLILAAPIAFPEFRPLEHPIFGPRALPFIGPLISEMSLRTFDAGMLAIAQRMMFAPHRPPPDWLARYPYSQVLQAAQMVEEGEDAANVFPGSPAAMIDYLAITAPVRILVGELDHIVYPLRHAKRLAMVLPSAELTARLDVGHMLHHTASDSLFEMTDELLSQTSGAAS